MTDPNLVIVQADVESLMRGIANVRQTFEGLQQSQDVSQHAGHCGLSGAISAFLGDWDVSRGKVQEKMNTLYDNVKSVDDTFRQLDQEIAAQMKRTP